MTGNAELRHGADRNGVALRDLSVRVLLPLWVALGLFLVWGVRFLRSQHRLGVDAHAYWLTAHHDHLYELRPLVRDAYLYSPAFAHAIRPVALLPWPAFFAIWIAAQTAAFAWLVRPVGWAWGVPAVMLCGLEILVGNVFAFIALATALGWQKPAAWAAPLLTKITPGLGPLWFAARREWIHLAACVGVTLMIAGGSFAIAPGAWRDWLHFLRSNTGAYPVLWLHVAAGALLCVVAALVDRRWLLAPAVVLACPVWDGWMTLTILAALPRLLEADRMAHSRGELSVS